jgi:hypothetical protein
MDTGIPAVDEAALERSFDILAKRMMGEDVPIILERIAKPVDRDYDRSQEFVKEEPDVLNFDESNPFADYDTASTDYSDAPPVATPQDPILDGGGA